MVRYTTIKSQNVRVYGNDVDPDGDELSVMALDDYNISIIIPTTCIPALRDVYLVAMVLKIENKKHARLENIAHLYWMSLQFFSFRVVIFEEYPILQQQLSPLYIAWTCSMAGIIQVKILPKGVVREVLNEYTHFFWQEI